MATTVSAENNAPKVLVSENGRKGDPGTNGTDGSGFNQVRKSLLDNPLCNFFKTNAIAEVSAPTNTDIDLTWLRSTTATYIDRYGIVQTASIDTPREEKKGFLVEGGSTNLLLRSEEFENASYNTTNTSVTADTTTAPDGTSTADTLDATVASGFIGQNVTISDDLLTRTISVFLKEGTAAVTTVATYNTSGSTVNNIFRFDWATFSTQSGVGNITQLADGWIRVDVSLTNNNTGNTTGIFRIFPAGDAGGTGTVIAWGGQFEDMPFASSYIPTTGSQATRGQDQVTFEINNNIVLSPISISFKYDLIGNMGSAQFLYGTGATANDIFSLVSSGTSVQARIGAQFESLTGTTNINQTYNMLYTSTITQMSTYRDGVANDISIADPGDFIHGDTIFTIGSQGASFSSPAFIHIKDFRLYDFILNQDEATYLGGL